MRSTERAAARSLGRSSSVIRRRLRRGREELEVDAGRDDACSRPGKRSAAALATRLREREQRVEAREQPLAL